MVVTIFHLFYFLDWNMVLGKVNSKSGKFSDGFLESI